MSYPNLEPNHALQKDGDLLVVLCPFTNPETGDPFETSWSGNAEEWEVNCLFCEYLSGDYSESPDHGDNG